MKESFPTEADGSHYYAAGRLSHATRRRSQQEKFLFYRGLASIQLPLSNDRSIGRQGLVEQGAGSGIDNFILFERRAGRIGYRVAHAAESTSFSIAPR